MAEITPEELPIFSTYDQQRFKQYNPTDCANWYAVANATAKKKLALYPAMGRNHINFLNINRLAFADEPRGIFSSDKYMYIVVDTSIFRVDQYFNVADIASGMVTTIAGNVFFDFLVAGTIVFACFTDGQHIYVYREDTETFYVVTDPNAPINPRYIAAFGNRLIVSQDNSSQFGLSEINLMGGLFDPATCFTINGQAVFAQETNIIKQMGVLKNTLYIMTGFTAGVWSNKVSTLIAAGGTTVQFPFTKNTTYQFDYGVSDPLSFDVAFGRMAWVGQSREGLFAVMVSMGDQPKPISTKAISVFFQKLANNPAINPFLHLNGDGFLYQYEDTVKYRISAGLYTGTGLLDQQTGAFSFEYDFETQTWSRMIELNGERNRIRKHAYFNNMHFVTVLGDFTVYQMGGQFYSNEIRNPDQPEIDAPDAYLSYPFRYELNTQIISEKDYAEFVTDWLQIDFVWGDSTFNYSTAPFDNAIYIIDEQADGNGNPIFVISEDNSAQDIYVLAEQGNTPDLNSQHYNNLFKPSIQLFWSDDGGISYHPHNIVEFSALGQYSWRMRWYQLAVSRNRCYRLICVSPSPIVVLGGTMLRRRISGGAS